MNAPTWPDPDSSLITGAQVALCFVVGIAGIAAFVAGLQLLAWLIQVTR